METPATSEQTRSYEKTETCESTEDMETERDLYRDTSAIANATVSSTEMNPTVHSSRNDPDEPITSTSKRETSPASPRKSRKNRSVSKLLFCAMNFWKRRSSDESIASVLNRSQRAIETQEPSSTVATTYDSEVRITQIEPSTVQTAREDNKRQAYVNVQMQTSDAIVTRILSEFLLSGEKKRKVLMSIILQSVSDYDSREVGTQTSSNDLTSGINMFDYSDTCLESAIMTASKTVQCFMCEKQDCYEMKQSDDSIILEETLITEYPEMSELNDYYIAEQKADIRIPP